MTTQTVIIQGRPITVVVTPQATPTVVIEKPIGLDGRAVELRRSGAYIQWRYVGDENWTNILPLVDIKGDQGIQGIQGVPGEEVLLQLSPTHIQWKYTSDVAWTDLISIAAITGPQGIQGIPGEDGTDGEQGLQGLPGIPGTPIEVQNNGTHIQWRYMGDTEWINLVALIDLTGQQGIPGIPGVDGDEVMLQKTATHIQWKYSTDGAWTDLVALSEITGADGAAGTTGNDGANGEEVLLQVSATHIQWKYTSDVTWTDLIALSALKGETGETGNTGADGEAVMLQNTGTHIQWKHTSDIEWTNIIAIADITGADGADGLPGATGDAGADGKTILNGTIAPTTEGVDGDFYINTSTLQIFGPKAASVWGTGTNIVGNAGADGTDGQDGVDGISIVWQGSLTAAPANPELNWGYYNTAEGKSYIWDGTDWLIIAQDGTGSGGGDFLSLTDTPAAYTNQAGKVPVVNTNEDALEFVDLFIPSVDGGLITETFEEAYEIIPHSGTWTLTAAIAYAGVKCLRSGIVGTNDGTSEETFTFTNENAGDLSFYYYGIAFENTYDQFTVILDDVTVFNTTTVNAVWTLFSTAISAGSHTLKLRFINRWYDFGGSSGVGVDQISYPATRTYNQGITEHSGIDSLVGNSDKLAKVSTDESKIEFIAQDALPYIPLLSGTELPTAAEAYRGKIFTLTGATGVADLYYVCIKDELDAYNWVDVNAAGSGGGGDVIDDAVTALDKTWSSTKIDTEFQDVEEIVDALLGTDNFPIIDDTQSLSTKTWSSEKITNETSIKGLSLTLSANAGPYSGTYDIPFNTIVKNDGGYTLDSGVITVSKSGWYIITCRCGITTPYSGINILFITDESNNEILRSSQNQTGGFYGLLLTASIYLDANDKIKARYYTGDARTINANVFETFLNLLKL